jgi:hypothetical protein
MNTREAALLISIPGTFFNKEVMRYGEMDIERCSSAAVDILQYRILSMSSLVK